MQSDHVIQNPCHLENKKWWPEWQDIVTKMNEVLTELFLGTQFGRFWGRHSKENLGTNVHEKIGFHYVQQGSNKTRFEYCLNSLSELAYVRGNSGALWWCNTSSGIDEPCINPIQLERIHLSQRLSITQSGLIAGGKESEEGRHTVFFTLSWFIRKWCTWTRGAKWWFFETNKGSLWKSLERWPKCMVLG